MGSFKKNVMFQTGYQILATALPLVTTPYVSRVFGADGLGEYSYALNISSYFMTFAMLGFNNYGSKSIASCGHDKIRMEKIYSGIRKLQMCTSLMAMVVYILGVCLLCDSSNRLMFLIQSLWIVDCFINVNWFFWGIEEVKLTVTRNFLIKIITLIGIFVFVKNKNDLLLYAVIMVIGTVLSDFYLIVLARRYVRNVEVDIKEVQSHLSPCLWLFVPIVAITLYQQIDKTMLGILSTYDQVGYYYNADKVVNIPLGIIAGFGTVSLPRIVSLIVTKKYDEYKKLVAKSISLIMFLCSAIVFGIITIVKHFVPLFFGAGFDDCIILISVLSFTIYFKSISTVIVNQVLIPNDNEKQYVASVFGGAFINTIVNYFLILRYGALGAVTATLLSELIVCLLQILMCKKNISISKLLLHNAYYVFAGIIMCVTTKLIVQKITINSMIVLTAVDIAIGAAIYCGLCMVYWAISKDQLFFPLIRNALKKLFVWRSVVK